MIQSRNNVSSKQDLFYLTQRQRTKQTRKQLENKVGGAEKFAFALGVESLDLLFSLLSGRVHVSEPSSGEETRVLSWTKYFKLCTYKNGTGDHSLLTH